MHFRSRAFQASVSLSFLSVAFGISGCAKSSTEPLVRAEAIESSRPKEASKPVVREAEEGTADAMVSLDDQEQLVDLENPADPSVSEKTEDFGSASLLAAAPVNPNDTHFKHMWGLHNLGGTTAVADADIDAPEAWAVARDCSKIKVAVVDTGVNYNHPDLKGNILKGFDFVDRDSDAMDVAGHGTHVAGTIGAVGNNNLGVSGVCWKAAILPVRTLGANGMGSTAIISEGVSYAINQGAKIVNLSIGAYMKRGTFPKSYALVVDKADKNGVLLIVAAGNGKKFTDRQGKVFTAGINNDTDPYPMYPAAMTNRNMIAVAATGNQDRLTSFSNFGPTGVDLAAPGSGILSTGIRGNYVFMNGTSMATPHVAGAVALLWSQNPTLDPLAIKARLLARADSIKLGGKVAGDRRLNIGNALR
jgi:large repetitive protein